MLHCIINYLILLIISGFQLSAANEDFNFILKDLKGIALYDAKKPFDGEAALVCYASKDCRWRPVKRFVASTSTKRQIVMFYSMPKTRNFKLDVDGNRVVVITEIIGTVAGERAQVIIENCHGKNTVIDFNIQLLAKKMNSKTHYVTK